jgi:hypothetical protein
MVLDTLPVREEQLEKLKALETKLQQQQQLLLWHLEQ